MGNSQEWLEKLKESIHLYNCIIVHGNVRDYCIYGDDENCFLVANRSFWDKLLSDIGYDIIGYYDLVDGLEFLHKEHLDTFKAYNKTKTIKNHPDKEDSEFSNTKRETYHVLGTMDDNFLNDEKINNTRKSNQKKNLHKDDNINITNIFDKIRNTFHEAKEDKIVFVINYAEFIFGSSKNPNEDDRKNLILLDKIFLQAKTFDPPQLIIFITNDLAKIPSNLYLDNPRCKQICITSPTKKERKTIIADYKDGYYQSDSFKNDDPAIEKLSLFTEGMTIHEIRNYLPKLSCKSRLSIDQAQKLVKKYKFGSTSSRWDELDKEIILGPPSLSDFLKQKVKGQEYAIEAIESMVIRAIQGIQSFKGDNTFSKPKGIFLFCGPTGVGKTELSKAFTEWLFGDENFMIRFDMSEFKQEHSSEKLIGSPPGYVGHEQGGLLTNAIKKKPFSIILFDEVDKMHEKIWDIFLQILEDGRLTDSFGDTVYFSETVIIMTSNIGHENYKIDGPEKTPDASFTHYLNSVREYFNSGINDIKGLNRPEILNRIGITNVIPFNPIAKDVQGEIVQMKLDSLSKQYKTINNINLKFDNSVIDYLLNDSDGFQQNGARGIDNLITAKIINTLAKELFYKFQKPKYPKEIFISIIDQQPDFKSSI